MEKTASHVLAYIAGAVGWSEQQLRDAVLSTTYSQVADTKDRILDPLNELPNSLAIGSISDNLDELAAGDEPADDFSWQAWTLLRNDHPKAEVIEVVGSLRDTNRTTRRVEQLHIGAANSAKHRPEFGPDMLTARGSW